MSSSHARQAVLDDLASRDERQPRVRDEERRREDGEEDDPEGRVEDDEEELLPHARTRFTSLGRFSQTRSWVSATHHRAG